jgi:hypothetical protein
MRDKPVAQWTRAHVLSFFDTLGKRYSPLQLATHSCLCIIGPTFNAYRSAFDDNAIDGYELLELKEDDLQNDFGIINKHHRKRILREIADINPLSHGAAASVAATGPSLPGNVRILEFSELTIERELSSGNFGVALLAKWRESPVVVKKLHGTSPNQFSLFPPSPDNFNDWLTPIAMISSNING